MIQERYIVYASRDRMEWSEASGHYDERRAILAAQKYASKHACYTRIDWLQEDISRNGRELLDCDADLYGFGPDVVVGSPATHMRRFG